MKKILILILTISSLQVLALGETGHRITGAIAEKYLTETTRNELAIILNNVSLAEISTYADEMRSSPDVFWKKTSKPWHYVTVPNGTTYEDIGSPKEGDAYFALAKYSKIVSDATSTKSEKALAVKFIVHLIADLHQPLHVGSGEDRGGNRVSVKFFGRPTNLHSLWDSGMINQKKLSYSEWSNWLSAKISDDDVKSWSDTDPLVWINESAEIRKTIYPKNKKNPSLSYDYIYNNLPILKVRMQQAGVRIAAYLNEIFDRRIK